MCAANIPNLNPKVFSTETTSKFCIYSKASPEFQSSHLQGCLCLFFRVLWSLPKSTRHDRRYEFVHRHVNEELCLPICLSSTTMPMLQLMPADFRTTCASEAPLAPPPATTTNEQVPRLLKSTLNRRGRSILLWQEIVASSSEVLESNWTALYSFADRARCENQKSSDDETHTHTSAASASQKCLRQSSAF